MEPKLVSQKVNRKITFWFVIVFIYTLIIFARTWKSIDRIGADTGYTYVPDAMRGNLSVIFRPFPEYFEISGRLIAELVAPFPISLHAMISTSLVNGIWIALAICIYAIANAETNSQILSFIAGLSLLLVPYAMESSLGNIGMIKFPMTAIVALVVCSRGALLKYFKHAIFGIFVVGLSQPILIITMLPLIWHLRNSQKKEREKIFILLIAAILVFLAQLFKVGLPGVLDGRGESSVRKLWPGMGLFWYSGIFFPITSALFMMFLNVFTFVRRSRLNEVRTLICISTVLLVVTSYKLGGIADRYFVAPMTLASIAGLFLLHDLFNIRRTSGKVLIFLTVIIAVIPVAKWFPAGWYLTSGPQWTHEVARGKDVCKNKTVSRVSLNISPSGSADVLCAELNK